MATELYSTSCALCGDIRSEEMNVPCTNCGSRRYPILGYVYPHEARAFYVVAILVVAALLIALALGAYYWYYVAVVLDV